MTQQPKKRLCWNCEGNVSINEETCPYCGVSVIPASLDGSKDTFAPPYSLEASTEAIIPPPPYAALDHAPVNASAKEAVQEENSTDTDDSFVEFKKVLIALMLLLTGSVFFLFGLVLALFSNQGVFTLQWNGTLWFIYSGLSLPLLLCGWRALTKIES